jgi:hypothetical protein
MLATQSFEHGLVFNATNGNLDAFNQWVLDYQDIVYNHARAPMQMKGKLSISSNSYIQEVEK